MPRDEIAAALDVWREGLINLSGTNRLIKFKASKTGAVFLDAPDPDRILSGIRSGWLWGFRGAPEPDNAEGSSTLVRPAQATPVPTAGKAVLNSPRADKDLGPVLRNLMRRANTEFLDRGLSVLYVAFGMLHWKDVDETDMASPLLLVPVELVSEGPKSTPRLRQGEDDEVFNPALNLRMREFGLPMPHIEDIDDLNVTGLLDRVREAVQVNPGWEVKPTVVLSSFSFHKEAMYRDLLENEEQVLAHPIVRAIGTQDPASQTGEFLFDPIDPADIDRVAPPEDTPLVLDADSSQRVAVAAAVAGGTFVMDGPPGTGKSQTIANMIGALLHAGKTVLFVSEKAAALEVVCNRLGDAGLENYLLELHSHKASRKEVSAALARALDNEPLPPQGMDVLDRGKLIEHRKRLNEYAEAINAAREPLDLSLHYVLGVLGNLNHVPSAPIPEVPPADLTQADYRAVQETAVKLERAWRPAAQGTTYLWREVTDDTSMDIRLYQAESALEELHGILDINRDLTDAFHLHKPSDATTAVALIDHQHAHRPAGALDQWLTANDWNELTALRDRLAEAIGAVKRAEEQVTGNAGVPWRDLPNQQALPIAPGRVAADHTPVDHTTLDAATASGTADDFDAVATRLEDRLNSLRGIATNFGLGDVTTYADADKVLALVDLAFVPHRPERAWLTDHGLSAARDAALFLQMSVTALNDAEATATKTFTGDVLAAPVGELHERFTTVHKGLKKLSGDYRADKKTVAALLTTDTAVDQGIHHLPDAITWVEANRAFETEVTTRAAALGRYWTGRGTDFVVLNDALRAAEEALTLVGGNATPPELGAYLTADQPPATYQTLAADIRADLDGWKASLAPAPELAGRPELLLDPIESAIAWLRAHVTPLRDAAARTRAVDVATGRTHTAAEADHLLDLGANAADAHSAIEEDEATYRAAFEDHFRAANTDLDTLGQALTWANELRTIAGGALTEAQVKALHGTRPTDNLTAAAAKWTDARDRIINAFAASRHTELLRELDDYRTAPEFINDLREDSIGQQEWVTYTTARADLAERGLDTAIDFCIEQRVPANQVPQVLQRALLRAWADHIIGSDQRLRPLLARDRAALIDEYRDLDRKLIVSATSDIIRAANARRPARTSIGEPGVIRREGMKKTRHIPVRDLIGRTKSTSMAIKPVFMMSPLAVSQYLPPDITFDVVIFDEASQVTPGDAINCIYRGKALILAGDDKQLPPTSFFERVVDEEGDEETDIADFQSVLELAKGCGGFNNLGLKWHYRSRHEALIAFSNYKFYEGNLVTYPSSHSDGPDVGVEFFHAHGTYRRGGGADNPNEAAEVAERVIEHFTTRPDLTLGVVTFSVAQADAIIDAIDKARENRRDLDRFFDTNDRLDGFFVRSLESVQGDERDVIIFSIGYGPDEAGKITTNFGVLNKPKGWRRLNVAITRARQRVEVVASLQAGNIPPSENENVEHLRAYLDYAERGQAALAIELGQSGLGPDSPFEESVIKAIKSWGYTVEPQVGAAGFRIDIGVRHPAQPGVFAIGIECDGYQYHSAPAARDRDRLRDQVLRGLGWTLHRIWGTSWYRNRQQEEDRLQAAIHAAINAPADGRVHSHERIARPEVTTIEVETFDNPTWTTEYTVADVPLLPRWIDPSDQGSRFNMVEAMEVIATVEGPVHLDTIYQRVRDAWGIGRVGYKIADNVDAAINLADVTREGDFIDLPGRTIDRVRTPSSAAFRKADQVHHGELRLAATLLLRDAGATPRADLIVGIARIFGWGRTGADIQRRLNETLDHLISSGEVTETDGHLALPL